MKDRFEFEKRQFDKKKSAYLLVPNRGDYKEMKRIQERMENELENKKENLKESISLMEETNKEMNRWKIDLKKLIKVAVIGKAVLKKLK